MRTLRAIAGDHLHGHVLLGEVAQGRRRVRAEPLAQHHQARWGKVRWELLVRQGARVGQQHHALSLGGQAVGGALGGLARAGIDPRGPQQDV